MTTQSIVLITTVRDEADNIADLLDSMLAQTRLPDEIVINDNYSQDLTPQIVAAYAARDSRIRLIKGAHNISSGRNNAIQQSTASIIASTDAGLILDPHWLERIVAPIEREQADVVGGFFRPAPHSLFELVLGATNYREPDEVRPEQFLPFGQSLAFRRSAWEQVGGFPEWLSHCEDLVFDMALKQAGFRFAFVPDALVHFRPRSDLWAFARQYFWYARGDGIAQLWLRRHLLRYATYLTGAALLAATPRRPWLLGVLAVGVLAYCLGPARRLERRAPALSPAQQVFALSLIPLIRLVGDLAKMSGYPVGVLHRLRSQTRK